MTDCHLCGDKIEITEETYLTVSVQKGHRSSWKNYARMHVDCFDESHGEGCFDIEMWCDNVD